MTKIKFCGLTRPEDIRAVNELKPDYAGFVFYEKSRRYLSVEEAEILKRMLLPDIRAVGVFVDAPVTIVADLLQRGIIDAAQLHGREDETYLQNLREKTDKPILQAFRIRTPEVRISIPVLKAARAPTTIPVVGRCGLKGKET